VAIAESQPRPNGAPSADRVSGTAAPRTLSRLGR
jgi:hypothetical protein